MAHHTILFGPRYKGLLDDIFKGSELPDDFSLYLHVPTVTDPSLAPEGCSAAYVLAPVPHLGRADADWDEIAEAYGDRIIEALEVEMPDLRNHIATRRHITPKTFQRELAAFQGSAFSVHPSSRKAPTSGRPTRTLTSPASTWLARNPSAPVSRRPQLRQGHRRSHSGQHELTFMPPYQPTNNGQDTNQTEEWASARTDL